MLILCSVLQKHVGILLILCYVDLPTVMTLCQKYKFETQKQKKSFVRPLGSAESLCFPKGLAFSTLQNQRWNVQEKEALGRL